jgi:glutamate-ammonia-ligase adenylyltransferase
LVRARAVAGDPALRARFGEVRAAILSRERDPLELARAVVEMRRRMQDELDRSQGALFDLKHGRGGITDVEFMVQYAVLRWAASHPRLLTWTDNLRLLEIIAELGLLPAADCRSLHDAYFAYRAEVHRRALQQEPSIVDGARFSATRDAVRLIWDRVFA